MLISVDIVMIQGVTDYFWAWDVTADFDTKSCTDINLHGLQDTPEGAVFMGNQARQKLVDWYWNERQGKLWE